MSDLVKRLRDAYDKVSCFPENLHNGFMLLLELRNIAPEAADRIEELERELDRINEINVKHCNTVNTLLIDGARMEERAKEIDAQLAAEKAMADRLYHSAMVDDEHSWDDARAAYRKARGL